MNMIIANDQNTGQPPAFIAAAGYGKDINYLDTPEDSRQVHPEIKNNQETSEMDR
jgi:hypothetical protein